MPATLADYRLRNMLRLTRRLRERYPAHEPLAAASPSVVIDDRTGLVTVDVEIVIDRDVCEVARAIDPQNWDEGSRFFYPDGTYLADPKDPTCAVGGPCRESPLPPGSDYDWAILRERFRAADPDGRTTEFDNLLWVNPDWLRTTDGWDKYVVTYLLAKNLGGRVGDVTGVKIVRDDGELSAKALGRTHTRVRMRKRIRFESPWANVATYVGFRAVERDLAAQFLETASAGAP
jgi:hypothetical protein